MLKHLISFHLVVSTGVRGSNAEASKLDVSNIIHEVSGKSDHPANPDSVALPPYYADTPEIHRLSKTKILK